MSYVIMHVFRNKVRVNYYSIKLAINICGKWLLAIVSWFNEYITDKNYLELSFSLENEPS